MYDNVFISGYTDLSLSESMAVSIKYSQLTGMEINNNQTAEEYYIKNYPNPFNPKTEIRYNLGTAGSVSLKVFDTNGKTVKDIINGKQNSGQHTVEFDGNELPSGVYFCALIVNGVNIQITKMVLLK
jgi:flagellar hook assembly protein FlgD